MDNQNFILGQEEAYNATVQTVWPFKKSEDVVEGINLKLSNMCGGFPIEAIGRTWPNSEVLYLCGEFTDPAIQQELLSVTSGYAAKRFIKAKHKKEVRADFEEFRLQWMLWVVWQKCLSSKAFRDLLMSIPDEVVLVEDTTTDNQGTADVWGCRNPELVALRKAREAEVMAEHEDSGMTKKALNHLIAVERNRIRDHGTWVGQNNIGKIIMICREAIKTGTVPQIDTDLLNSRNITILGQKVTF